jgi:UDP-GlcNAc:undecaprenyl-phosphate/decaprenyl-phosphate GlcNAc-1-phosphate transferase
MMFYLKPIIIAAIVTFIAIYTLRPFAVKFDLLDIPNDRKKHDGKVPLIGGIAMFVGIFVSLLMSSVDLNSYNYFIAIAFIIIFIGAMDDFKSLSVSHRLLFQLIAALIMVTAGDVKIDSIGNILGYGDIALDEWSMLFSVLAVIGAINAVNMADGIHGLAGGNSLVSFVAISYLSFYSINQSAVIISLLFCGVLPIFLINNLCIGIPKNKRIFMGDAGSMFIGFSLAWVLCSFSQGENRSFSPVITLWLFALPLFEIFCSVLRRLISGVSPFKPDSAHTHHLLIKIGFTEKKTLMIIIIFSILMAIIGLIGSKYKIDDHIMFLGFLCIFIFYFVTGELLNRRLKINKMIRKN